jgi:hypothetical protein
MCQAQEEKDVLILGNGHSVKSLQMKQLEKFQLRGEIFVMNDFHLSPLAEKFCPQYYFIADPEYWRPSTYLSEMSIQKLKTFLESNDSIVLVQPANENDFILAKKRIVYFQTFPFHGMNRSMNPLGLWSQPASIALIAIATARYWGYRTIYFAGLDSSSYRSYSVDELNHLRFSSEGNYFFSYFQNQSPNLELVGHPQYVKDPTLRTMTDVLYSAAVLRNAQKKLLGKHAINVGNDLYNDSSPRASLI